MFKTLLSLAVSSLLIFGPSNASAQGSQTFRIVSKASGKCISLKAPDQSDGGGLTMKDCQNFPDFNVTAVGSSGEIILQFRLNSSRFVCIFATETPVIDPTGRLAKVDTRNCVTTAPASFWNIRGTDSSGFQQIEKKRSFDFSNFCMRENIQTSEVELDVCGSGPVESWKLAPVP